MEPHQFNVGDRIEVLDKQIRFVRTSVGKCGTITQVRARSSPGNYEHGAIVEVEFDDGTTDDGREAECRLVPNYSFKIGDRVRVKRDRGREHGTTIVFLSSWSGTEGVVVRVEHSTRRGHYIPGGDAGPLVTIENTYGDTDYGRACELELVSSHETTTQHTGSSPTFSPIGFRDGHHMACENSSRTHVQIVHSASGRSFEVERCNVAGLAALLSHIDQTLPRQVGTAQEAV